jgi:hypothetical protein
MSWRSTVRGVVAAALVGPFALGASVALARGVSPYLPLSQSPEIERQIERLLILADRPILTRPIAAATVFDALPAACERDAALCDEVRRYLSGYMRKAGIAHAGFAVGGGSGDATTLPNRRGMQSKSNYELSLGLYWQPSDYVLLNAGVQTYEGDSTPTGSVISMGVEHAQIDIGYRDQWLSPFTDSAMLLGTQSRSMPSITISNYTPISRLGLSYQVFIAEMSESADIGFEGRTTVGKPKLGGLHLSIQPFSGWTLGVTRVLQFGGGERNDSLRDLFDAFFDPSDADNTGTDADFGNQVAAFSSRFILPGPVPAAVYFEYAGEDTSTLSNLRLGNSALSVGIDLPMLGERFDLTFEASEWQNAWYVHHVYRDGLRNEGNVVGHWGGDWRALQDGTGARSWMARVGWRPPRGGRIDAQYRSLQNEEYGGIAYVRAYLATVRYSRPWQDFYVGAELDAGRDSFGESFSRVSAFIRF